MRKSGHENTIGLAPSTINPMHPAITNQPLEVVAEEVVLNIAPKVFCDDGNGKLENARPELCIERAVGQIS
jgi:hypothetical protein